MRAIAQGAPPPTYMGGRLGRDTLPLRGLLLDGSDHLVVPAQHRVERDQVPVCHGRTSADGSSSLDQVFTCAAGGGCTSAPERR